MAAWIKMPLGMEVGLNPGDCVRGDPAPSPKRGTEPPVFGPRLLWPNGCMDQDATWYGGGLGPGDVVFNEDPATVPPPEKRAHPPHPIFGPCLLCPNGWMDQDATWYGGMPRRIGDIELDGDPALLPKRGTPTPPQ